MEGQLRRRWVLMVCFIADPFDPPGHERFGGGHLFLFDLARQLIRSGFRVTHLTRRNSSSKPTHQRIGRRFEIFRIDVGPRAEISIDQVARDCDELVEVTADVIRDSRVRPQVIHTHYWISGFVVRRLFEKEMLRDQRHVHSILSLGRLKAELGEEPTAADALRDRAEVKVFTEVDELVAVCPSEVRDLRRLYPEASATAIRMIPYAIDTSVFSPRPGPPDSSVRRARQRFEEGT